MIVRAIILNYNTVDLTVQNVIRIRKQLSTPNQVVIVDNSSTKTDWQILQASLPSGVTLIRSTSNRGYASGNNLGIGVVADLPAADAYLILNSDVYIFDPTTVGQLIAALNQDPAAVAISPLVHTLSNAVPVRQQIQVRRLLPAWQLLFCHSPIGSRLPFFKSLYNQFIYRDLVPYSPVPHQVDTINGACFLIKAAFLDELGGLDENTFLYLEELIVGHQIRHNKQHCLLHGNVVVWHNQGQSTQVLSARTRFRHFLDSEAYLLTHYYNLSRNQVGILRAWRWIEFHLKALFVWVQ